MTAAGAAPLPLTCFRLREQRCTVQGRSPRAVSGSPSTVRACCYGGTGTLTMPASPATAGDGSDGVPMSGPATVRTPIVAVICRVDSQARGALLTGMGRVYPLHGDTRACRFIGDAGGKLVQRPGGHHALVFAGLGPTACAGRALADPSALFHANAADTLLLGMGDELVRELVVGVAHPPRLFA